MKSVAEALPTNVRELVDSTLPVRPRFLSDLVVAGTGQGLVIDGASQLHVLWGDTAKSVLPTMIRLMDGTRTVAEIAASFPDLTLQQVREPLLSLCSWGLVEEGAEDGSCQNGNPETTSFLGRYSGGYAAGRSGKEAFARLVSRAIILVASRDDEHAAQYLSVLLTDIGVASVSYSEATSLDFLEGSSGSSRSFLVSLSLGSENHEQQCRLDDYCAAQGLPWLRITIDEAANFADIGPVFDRTKTSCYRCFTATHGRSSQIRDHGPSDFERAKFWLCMAAAEITYLLSGVGAPRPDGWFRRHNLKDWTSRALCFPMIPGCACCRPLPGATSTQPAGARIDTAVVFEDYVVSRSAPSIHTGATISDPQALVELTRQTKRLSNCSQRSLPAVLPELSTPFFDQPATAAATTSLDLNKLAALLKMTAGVRRISRDTGMSKRWAATAGNLGSVELFIAARNVEGLAQGYYFYQPQEHSLASFRRHSGSLAVEDFMRRAVADSPQELPDALILFTGAYHRVASKYGAFAYRLVNLDAGVAISQLKMVAASLGLSARLAPRWADDLTEDQLNLDPMAEQSTAVVSLCGKHNQRQSPGVERDPAEPLVDTHSSTKPPHAFCDLSVPDVARMVYLESRIHEKELRAVPFVVPETLHTPNRRQSETIPLPIPLHNRSTLGDILKARSSVRRYRNDPPSLQHLSAMLSFAQRADVLEWPQENQSGMSLNFTLLAQRVENLKAGVYEYESAERRLNLVGDPPCYEQLARLYVQAEFATAPLAIWITGSLAASCAWYGAFGHRQLLLRAGAAGNRLWVAAIAMGLSGTLIAGMSGSARRILNLDGYLRTGLLAVALGYATPHLSG
jgi:SagB-type dehydrogenase family enzyme